MCSQRRGFGAPEHGPYHAAVRKSLVSGISVGLIMCIAVGCTQQSSTDRSAATVATVPVSDSNGTGPSVRAGWVDYTDPSGVELAHPQDWTVEPGAAGPLIVFVDPAKEGTFRRNVNGLLQRVQAGLTLDQYIAASKKGFDAVHTKMISGPAAPGSTVQS